MRETVNKDQCVVGVFDSIEPAKLAIHILDRAGFAPENISVVAKHIQPDTDVEQELSVSDDSLRDAAVGAALGSVAAILGEAALFLITGIGTVLVAGPLMVATGAVVGGLLGAMEGWGIHKAHIDKYEKLVGHGKTLVVIDGDPEKVAEADRMLRQTKAQEVHLYAKSDDDAPETDDQAENQAEAK